jgi:AraC-like DNA-binding protein
VAWSRVLCFTDPVACQAAFPYSDTEVLPTTKDFRIEMTQVAMSRLWLQRTHLSSSTVSTATSMPGRRSIGFLTESNLSNYHHCGIEVMPGDIIVNTLEAEHRRCDSGLDYGSMSIPTEELGTAVEAITGCELVEKSEARIFHPHPQLMSRLLKLHRAIGQLAQDSPELLQLPEVLRAMENEFVHVMVRCLADAVAKPSNGGRRHDSIMARFEEFLEANLDRPLYLTEICAAVGVAERTLRACCEEHLGMGPIRFLSLRRMHLAHRALLRADPSKSTVTRIVTDQGFWELGRFSVAYRALFGESPSETLQRPAEQAVGVQPSRL